MLERFKVMGHIENEGTFDFNITNPLIDELKSNNIKFLDRKKIIGAQIGGVLGEILLGDELKNSLNKYNIKKNYILLLDNLFCPVDYIRFLSRFLIRELKIDNSCTREFNQWIEDIAQGKSKINRLEEYKEILSNLDNSIIKNRLENICNKLITNFQSDFKEHILSKKCKNGICRTLISAQCINACPAGVNIPGYVALMKNNQMENAYSLMRQTNPLSLICGKICSRPCEDRCRRKEIENTVGVRALQRYISENVLSEYKYNETKGKINNKKIAVIGAGPAGLTSAYFLQRTGYQVDIYEALSNPGGVLGNCIPKYRMPLDDIIKEVETIKSLGVNIFYNTRVGKDISMDYLKEKYDSIIVASGAWVGKTIPSFSDLNIITAIDFLKDVRSDSFKKALGRVAIIGGGDVAMDSARTAIRLGAENVTNISLEAFEEMPANIEEKDFAVAEGVKFLSSFGVNKIDKKDNSLILNLKKCIEVYSLDGSFNPLFSNETLNLEFDTVILAIGQKPDTSFLRDNDFQHQNIHFVGDILKIGSAVDAIAGAKKISSLIDKNLGGAGLFLGETIEIPNEQLSIKLWDFELNKEKENSCNNLNKNFNEIVKTYDKDSAFLEAKRCMRCDRNSIKPLWLR